MKNIFDCINITESIDPGKTVSLFMKVINRHPWIKKLYKWENIEDDDLIPFTPQDALIQARKRDKDNVIFWMKGGSLVAITSYVSVYMYDDTIFTGKSVSVGTIAGLADWSYKLDKPEIFSTRELRSTKAHLKMNRNLLKELAADADLYTRNYQVFKGTIKDPQLRSDLPWYDKTMELYAGSFAEISSSMESLMDGPEEMGITDTILSKMKKIEDNVLERIIRNLQELGSGTDTTKEAKGLHDSMVEYIKNIKMDIADAN